MAYYNGTANSYGDLLTALVGACTAHGWTWADGILSKGTAFLSLTVRAASGTLGPGIIMRGGTGKSGASLLNPSPSQPRLGPPSWAAADVVWPVAYEIMAFTDPDEVYLIARHNTDRYIWLSFGVSPLPATTGTGFWLSATGVYQNGVNQAAGGVGMNFTASAISTWNGNGYYGSAGGPFCRNSGFANDSYMPDAIHVGLDGLGWAGNQVGVSSGSFNAIYAAATQLKVAPSAWNQDAALVPIQVHLWRPSSKCSMVLDVQNARYLRIDNYDPEQVVTLGADRWKIFPFYRKNTAARNGGSQIDHTGTFGWAIRYDGP